MDEVGKSVEFEWDSGNIGKNWGKHGVTEKESEEVFINEPLLVREDTKHSQKEKRFFALGKTNNNRKLFISFTMRSKKIRIISARDMDKKEKNTYEKGI